MSFARAILAVFGLPWLAAASSADGQLRVVTWNVTSYTSGRAASFQTALYGSFQGRALDPDILMGQEFNGPAAAAAFLAVLNGAPGGPRDWALAPYIDGPDFDNTFFFRTSRIKLVGSPVLVLAGGAAPAPPRNLLRFDIRPVGYFSDRATIACYVTHMKAGDQTEDQARRLLEAQAFRANAEGLPAGVLHMIAGDLNIQSSSQAAYQEMVGSKPNNRGRVFDPINTPGSWNNNQAFRFVHTQSPGGVATTTGGMDDRLDQLLLSSGLLDGDGFDYIGSPAQPYSTTTWNDPNHSHRAWGNDGTSFNKELTVAGNAFVGATIAQALRDTTSADQFGGHLPVLLDLRVPPRIATPAEIDFGRVQKGSPAQASFIVTNAGDIALWTAAGIADLKYSMIAGAGFSAPTGTFIIGPGPGVAHTITLDTSIAGIYTGTLTVSSNAPDEPTRLVSLRGEVVEACYADCDPDGVLDIRDFSCFQNKFATSDPAADCTGDGVLDIRDFNCFQNKFSLGCP